VPKFCSATNFEPAECNRSRIMWLRHLSVGMAILSAGCAAGAEGSVSDVARTGYLYHDANHPGGASQASPPAVYNATHGTWLWPPAATPH